MAALYSVPDVLHLGPQVEVGGLNTSRQIGWV